MHGSNSQQNRFSTQKLVIKYQIAAYRNSVTRNRDLLARSSRRDI